MGAKKLPVTKKRPASLRTINLGVFAHDQYIEVVVQWKLRLNLMLAAILGNVGITLVVMVLKA